MRLCALKLFGDAGGEVRNIEPLAIPSANTRDASMYALVVVCDLLLAAIR
jgi:hypothetical protein